MSPVGGLNTALSPYLQSSLASGDLRTALGRRLEERQQAALEAARQTGGSSLLSAAQYGLGVMSSNFAQRDSAPSKYVQATLDSFKRNGALATAQSQSAFAMVLEAQSYISDSNGDGELSSAELYLAGRKAERMITRKRREKEREAGEEALEQIKDEREKTTREIFAPKDADGTPILAGPGAVAAEETSAPELTPATSRTGADAPQTTPLPEQAQYAAPAGRVGGGIDIQV